MKYYRGEAQKLLYILAKPKMSIFSLFAGLTIIWNFVMMVTWVPAWFILHHNLLVVKLSSKLPSLPQALGFKLDSLYEPFIFNLEARNIFILSSCCC